MLSLIFYVDTLCPFPFHFPLIKSHCVNFCASLYSWHFVECKNGVVLGEAKSFESSRKTFKYAL